MYELVPIFYIDYINLLQLHRFSSNSIQANLIKPLWPKLHFIVENQEVLHYLICYIFAQKCDGGI